MSAPGGKTILTVSRALDVLSFFGRHTGRTLGVTEISKELGLSKAVVHRILTTLVEKGYISLDLETRRYSLGVEVLMLGLSYLDRVDVRALALPVMRELVEETGETSTLSIRTGDTRIYLDQITPPTDVKMSVRLGHPYPLHAGSSSKAILAFMSEEEREHYLTRGPLDPWTPTTITDADALRDELAEIRRRGFARSLAERQAGAASIAAPVLDHRGLPVAAISICGPMERFESQMEEAAASVVRAARGLSVAFGFRDDGHDDITNP